MAKRLILCDCGGSQTLDREALAATTGLACSRVHSALCSDEISRAAEEIGKGGAVIACAQEAALFGEIAADLGLDAPLCVDLRDRAGWSDEGARATPKMAALLAEALLAEALLAEALLESPVEKSFDIASEGRCLILGPEALALDAAAQLAGHLAVTVLLEAEPEEPPLDRRFDVVLGRLRRAQGSLGAFTVEIDALRQFRPGGRAPGFAPPRDGARSECDIVLDLSGGRLFGAGAKRDGYLRAEPSDSRAVARAIFAAAQLVGTFEKPLYARTEPLLCAHARAGITSAGRPREWRAMWRTISRPKPLSWTSRRGASPPALRKVSASTCRRRNRCAGGGASKLIAPDGQTAEQSPQPAQIAGSTRT